MSQLFEISITDIVGYLATAIVLVSFLMPRIKMLRIISIIGSGLFVVYGIMLSYSYPVIITNVAVICINAYFLIIRKSRDTVKS